MQTLRKVLHGRMALRCIYFTLHMTTVSTNAQLIPSQHEATLRIYLLQGVAERPHCVQTGGLIDLIKGEPRIGNEQEITLYSEDGDDGCRARLEEGGEYLLDLI